jgi:hypothetical protein
MNTQLPKLDPYEPASSKSPAREPPSNGYRGARCRIYTSRLADSARSPGRPAGRASLDGSGHSDGMERCRRKSREMPGGSRRSQQRATPTSTIGFGARSRICSPLSGRSMSRSGRRSGPSLRRQVEEAVLRAAGARLDHRACRLRRFGECPLPRRCRLRFSAATRNHRPDPVRQRDQPGRGATTGAAQVDRGGEPNAGLAVRTSRRSGNELTRTRFQG